MPKIFISYRRQDSNAHAGRVSDSLIEAFGAENVFFDMYSLMPGEDFADAIRRRISGCDVLLAIIARQWLTSRDTAMRSPLDNAGDFVRLEIETALAGKIPVIPVLVDRAAMPDERQLPESLRALTRYQAVELSDSRWPSDIRKLVDYLGKVRGPSGHAESNRPTPPRVQRWAMIAALCVLGPASFGLYEWVTRRSTSPDHALTVKAADRSREHVAGSVESASRGIGPANVGRQAVAGPSRGSSQSTEVPDTADDPTGADPKKGRLDNTSTLARANADHPPEDAAHLAGRRASTLREADRAKPLAHRGAASDDVRRGPDAGLPGKQSVVQTPDHLSGLAKELEHAGTAPPAPAVQTQEEIAAAKAPLIAQLNALQLRRDVIVQGLDSLRDRQGARGFSLRSDMAAAELRMNRQLSAAGAEVQRPNMDREAMSTSLRVVQDAIETLEEFLNIREWRKP